MKNWSWLVSFAIVAMIGCSGGPSSGGNNIADAGYDGDGNACTPKVSCSADECGRVDDGCGGTVQCEEACRCEEGEATVERCGTCGLGQVLCDTNENGEGTCESLDFPGLEPGADSERCAEALIFVDKSAAESSEEGSREEPFRTLSAALAEAEAGQTIVVGRELEYAKVGGFELKEGVSLVGGFAGAPAFTPQAAKKPTLLGRAAPDQAVFGLKAENIAEDTLVANVMVRTEDVVMDPSDAPPSNYGVWVVDSEGLALSGVHVEAGAAADGEAGEPGDVGGQPAQAPAEPTLGQLEATEGGKNFQCPDANGGNGGRGGFITNTGTLVEPNPGDVAPGDLGNQDAGEAGTASGKSGGNGSPGAPGQKGTDGVGGEPGGSLFDGLWVAEGRGEDGTNGGPGVGGAGGGGAWTESCGGSGPPYYFGPNGGAGGAGGCGGTAGRGGAPGGGSFGLFLVDSTVQTANAVFRGGDGGAGGAGGSGGAGGPGDEGGQGTNITKAQSTSSVCEDPHALTYGSGDGGDGGDGGRGGHGGGGAGGVSYGAFCMNGALEVGEDVVLEGGEPGSAGPAAAPSGTSGLAGESAGQRGCE